VNDTFVGRTAELSALDELCRRGTRTRDPAAAIVRGDPGSGKTRLLREVRARSPFSEGIALEGFEPERQIPLSAAWRLIDRLIGVSGPGSDLERLLVGHEVATGPLEPLRVFEGARRALVALGPALLTLDDLQWADDLSVALCHYLVRAAVAQGPALVLLVASRPDPTIRALEDALAQTLSSPEDLLRLDLGPLSAEDGVRLLSARTPSIRPDVALRMWRRAGGSPFWLVALASGEGELDARELVNRRVRDAGADVATLLTLLAVAGRPVGANDGAEILGWPEARMHEAAAGLVRSGLAVAEGDALRAGHDLVREAVEGRLPPGDRVRVHRRIAAWLEQRAGDDPCLFL
jgi:predicted ATPase